MPKFPASFSYLSNSAPIISMSALALFSFALIKQTANTQNVSTPISPSTTAHNYYLSQFFTSQFNAEGVVKAYIKGDSALHFDESKQLSIANFNFYLLNQQALYQGTANKAMLDDSANVIELYDFAKVKRLTLESRPMTTIFQSDYFYIRQEHDAVSANIPKEIQTEKNISYKNKDQQLHMTGRVKIRMESNK